MTELENNKKKQVLKKLDYVVVLFLQKKKGKSYCTLKTFRLCMLHFKLTFNNVHITLIKTTSGEPLFFLTAGLLGLRNSNKSTPLATRAVSLEFFNTLQSFSNLIIHVQMLGYGSRLRVFFSEMRSFLRRATGARLVWISNVVQLPLNGCKAERRVL